MTKSEAIAKIHSIRNGSGVDCTLYPETMKGSLSVRCWNNEYFTYGYEYGVIWGLMDAFDIGEKDLNS